MKKFILLTLAGILLISCDAEKLFKKAPVIEELIITPEKAIVHPGDTVFAEVKATNPEEGELTYHWTISPEGEGFILDPVDRAAIRWLAANTAGDYTFKIKVSNSYKSAEQSKIVKVRETSVPVVRIVKPKAGDYLVATIETEVEVRASHNNGIAQVHFYVNDVFQESVTGSSENSYFFGFTPDSGMVGKAELKAVAKAISVATPGADSIEVNVEGILPGK